MLEKHIQKNYKFKIKPEISDSKLVVEYEFIPKEHHHKPHELDQIDMSLVIEILAKQLKKEFPAATIELKSNDDLHSAIRVTKQDLSDDAREGLQQLNDEIHSKLDTLIRDRQKSKNEELSVAAQLAETKNIFNEEVQHSNRVEKFLSEPTKRFDISEARAEKPDDWRTRLEQRASIDAQHGINPFSRN